MKAFLVLAMLLSVLATLLARHPAHRTRQVLPRRPVHIVRSPQAPKTVRLVRPLTAPARAEHAPAPGPEHRPRA